MTKLPSIFHSNDKVISNNKNSYISSDKFIDKTSFDKRILVNYFNKSINITLNNGNKINGILISKRGDTILLNSGEYININDISSVK